MAREFPAINKTEFTAKIPTPMYNEFIGFLPIHGVNTWFIMTAMNRFLEHLRRDPTLAQRVKEAVDSVVAEV